MNSYQMYNKRNTPQSAPIPGANQVQNNAGGFVYQLNDWGRLDRFLLIGSDKPTYYCGAKKMTFDNAKVLEALIAQDGPRVVRRIVEISHAGRAPKNDPALFALALCASAADKDTRLEALHNLPKVARTGTHLFQFMGFAEQFRGWGKAMRAAVGAWYLDKPNNSLVYQAIKYQQRGGWSHRDALRLAHPKTDDPVKAEVFRWIVDGWPEVGEAPHPDANLVLIWAMERLKGASVKEACRLISDYELPFEVVPTEMLKERVVWEALLPNMGITAIVRNLGRLTANGVLSSAAAASFVTGELTNENTLKRVHPINLLIALGTYQQGRGDKGSLEWTPITKIVDALDEAFYAAFDAVEATGKRMMLALDVSGSMAMATVGETRLTPRAVSAALALVTKATEKEAYVMGFSNRFMPLDISPRRRLDDNIRAISNLPFEGTDCALPMLYALENKISIDTFVIYTDNETWAGKVHPSQALRQYREKTGINAKLIVVGMTSTGFTIADPEDSGMLDVVGFDAALPSLIEQMALM
jgi:60 kDa SS-A/Ro ribonucleoprotein